MRSFLLLFFFMHIIQPKTPEEFKKYYELRFETLRKPWNQPLGSERDPTDPESIHAMLMDDETPVGVCRLNFNTSEEGQIRYMGIADSHKNKGLGGLLISYLENVAKEKGAKYIILHAREKAVSFYLKQGYKIVEKSYLMWGEIQHYLMRKVL